MSPYVQDRLKAHFPEDFARVKLLEAQKAQLQRQTDLEADLLELKSQIKQFKVLQNKKDWAGEPIKDLSTQKKQKENMLKKNRRVISQRSTLERYIVECR
jgi:hypothetical protein